MSTKLSMDAVIERLENIKEDMGEIKLAVRLLQEDYIKREINSPDRNVLVLIDKIEYLKEEVNNNKTQLDILKGDYVKRQYLTKIGIGVVSAISMAVSFFFTHLLDKFR